MKYHIYKVEKVEDYRNTASTINYDYTKDFNELKALRGYVKLDYYISDTPELKSNEVYFTGDLIKVIEKIVEFDGEPIRFIFAKN